MFIAPKTATGRIMSEQITDFASLGLPGPLMAAVSEVGYEEPSPIQAQAIPLLLAGSDLLGQAQTGTGKTAAFALPLLARIDASANYPQMLVLAPTRELALQVAEAMQTYARFLPGFHVLPIYGGQGMGMQLNQLRRGVQVVVGTPGRVMDHMRRGTLDISRLRSLVLDEADEMLRMGFIDDVDWILEHTPADRQIALFSATMPNEIRRVAERHLNNPQHIKIASKTTTAENIRQRYWPIGGLHKLDALTRILESETFDGVIIFVRTKTQTTELAEKLSARGFAAEALNGDVAQVQRERTVSRLRDGKLDILVATDVAARGLDVRRVTHVINYDIPHDTESYVHRIGRTGRAGAAGEAILFVAPRERRMLRSIEKATGHPIDPMELPSVKDINSKRTERFKTRVRETIANDDLALYYRLVSELEHEDDLDALQIAAALAQLAQGDVPLLLDPKAESKLPAKRDFEAEDRGRERKPARPERPRSHPQKVVETKALPLKDFPDIEMERFRVAVGYQHGVKPGNIVGAIANEADLEARYIGHIEIFDDFTTVDLPAGMPEQTMRELRNAWVCQQRLAIERLKDSGLAAASDPKRPARRPVKPAAEHERFQKPARKPRKESSADKPLKGSAVDEKAGQGRPGERESAATKRPGRKPDAKPAATKPGGKPVGFKGKKKSKVAGDRPLKKRLTLKKGPKSGL
jgi:ATP-dependent RNA helicase DeaD